MSTEEYCRQKYEEKFDRSDFQPPKPGDFGSNFFSEKDYGTDAYSDPPAPPSDRSHFDGVVDETIQPWHWWVRGKARTSSSKTTPSDSQSTRRKVPRGKSYDLGNLGERPSKPKINRAYRRAMKENQHDPDAMVKINAIKDELYEKYGFAVHQERRNRRY